MTIAFDLDDTLAKEREFCLSGFRKVAESLRGLLDSDETLRVMTEALLRRENHYSALEALLDREGKRDRVEMKEVVATLRNHYPDYSDETKERIRTWIGEVRRRGYRPAIITDGRSVTQRNKLRSLGLTELVAPEDILISSEQGADKHEPLMFRRLMELHPEEREFVYVGDNTAKDFRRPKELGWKTVGIRDRDDTNIHPQLLEGEGVVCPDIFL